MKVKSFLQNALPNSRRFYRRGLRGRFPNVHFERNSNERCSTHSQIELESLQKTTTVPKAGPSGQSKEHPLEFNPQVYNTTSELVDSGAQESSLGEDIRDTIHEIINSGDEVLSGGYSKEGRFSRIYATLICLLIVGTICAVSLIVVYYGLSKSHGKTSQEYHKEELELLSHHEWPLQDLESSLFNVSFNTLKREESEWHFDLSDNSAETTTQRNFVKAKVSKPYLQGFFTLNGHLLDPEIEDEIFKSAREILKSQLHKNSSDLEILSWKGVATNFVIDEIKLRFNVSGRQGVLEGMFEDEFCDKTSTMITCNKTSWYRLINGSCNNFHHKTWGSLHAPIRRILLPSKVIGQPPLSNETTAKLTSGQVNPDPSASALLPLWGMFILHDTSKVAESPIPCHDDTEDTLKSCGLVISRDNLTATKDNVKCFQTSNCPADYPSCVVSPRTSFNLVTSFIDASNIYGSSDDRLEKLRTGQSGKMKVAFKKNQAFLPYATTLYMTCAPMTIPNCVVSGDDDVNKFVPLTALNTVFLRQHNSIAGQLGHLNPHWSDDRIFEETRRIVIAQVQHITYNEFLPSILGPEIMNFTGLSLEKSEFYALYDPVIDPSVSDAYAAAVGYFWSSMAVDKIELYWKSEKHSMKTKYNLGQEIYRPEILVNQKGHLEAIFRGFSSMSVSQVGLGIPKVLRSIHVPATNKTMDLVQKLLEKGRKLQLAPYVEWRKACSLPEIKSFDDLEEHWYSESVQIVSSIYKDLKYVDLFTGMLAETPFSNSRVGPTLACLLTDQFMRFKKGDRYWYEGDVYFHHFTRHQLKSIRETTLSRILCDTTGPFFNKLQQRPMLIPSDDNLVKDCSEFPEITFHFWKDDGDQDLRRTGDENDSDEIINDVWIYDESSQTERTEITETSLVTNLINPKPLPHYILLNDTTTTDSSTSNGTTSKPSSLHQPSKQIQKVHLVHDASI